MGLGLWAQSAADVRPPRAPASAPDTAAAGKDPWIRRAVTGELPEPHAPSALLELSSLDPGLGARAQDERRAASIARGSRHTRSEKRSGCITRQCWSSRLSRLGVCEGTLSVSVSVSAPHSTSTRPRPPPAPPPPPPLHLPPRLALEGGHCLPAQLLRGQRHLALRVVPRRLPTRPLVATPPHTPHTAPPG